METTKQLNVLLVDDESDVTELFSFALRKQSYTFRTALSGSEALEQFERQPADILVTDIEMPGIDGLGLTRRLRADPLLADLPIVVVSTLDRPADRLAGLESGADAYLTKQGLDARELVALVYRVGGGR